MNLSDFNLQFRYQDRGENSIQDNDSEIMEWADGEESTELFTRTSCENAIDEESSSTNDVGNNTVFYLNKVIDAFN